MVLSCSPAFESRKLKAMELFLNPLCAVKTARLVRCQGSSSTRRLSRGRAFVVLRKQRAAVRVEIEGRILDGSGRGIADRMRC